MLKTRIFILVSTVLSGALQAGLPAVSAEEQEEIAAGTEYGEPIQGITAREFELFRLGLENFAEVETTEDGLGPLFNARSCAECHSVPRIGGSGTIMEVRAGIRKEDGSFADLYGGSLFQMFSIAPEQMQRYIPPEVNVIAHRKSLALFGDGLVEAVPDEALIALEDPEDRDGDGIRGRAHRVSDKATGLVRIGRFGWKAQQATLLSFGAEAYRDEMGITSALFPDEVCPDADCERMKFVDRIADPEDTRSRTTGLRGIDNFENFMKLIGPPPAGPMTEQAKRGKEVFHSIACHSCHVPSLKTGASPVKALSFKLFFPYGDFLLHDMGTGDGIAQGDAKPGEIRTPPLWGVRFRAPFMHDGRAATLKQAIEMHRVEGEKSRVLYEKLSDPEKDALLAFLKSL